ncbi:hypothetical protein EVAR_31618_1 [Eumeta japonica]|uniref:Uncharacterized protein n=1 Tax=Eumeta variegata TaxID=151549 RepID=A0A4C1W1X1_EUMVA|nr:hypothetical protein EVAR_31618_1 [Eumeta japonica]
MVYLLFHQFTPTSISPSRPLSAHSLLYQISCSFPRGRRRTCDSSVVPNVHGCELLSKLPLASPQFISEYAIIGCVHDSSWELPFIIT